MAVRKITKIGDVFSIPIVDDLCAIGQVLIKRAILYVAIFSELKQCNLTDVEVAMSGHPVLVGWTMDAKIYHGDWKIIGTSTPLPCDDLKRNYTVEHRGKIWVEDFDSRLLHPASSDEAKSLFNRSSYSPARLERVIRAYHKLETWDSEFDDLLVAPSRS